MPATFGAVIAVIFLSAISLLGVVAVALVAFVETGRREDPAARLGPPRSLATSAGVLRPSCS
jgi:hypothetical protein